jgi:hypothetical protein
MKHGWNSSRMSNFNSEPRPPQAMALTLKYRDEQEYLLRRLGQALVLQWDELPDNLQDVLIDQAAGVRDREEDAPHERAVIETFIRSVKTTAV